MRPHQPTPTPHMKGDNRRQRETRPLQSPRRRPHQPTPTPHIKGDNRRQWETMGDNGRQDHFRAQETDHTNQHQGGQISSCIKNPNSKLFGEKAYRGPAHKAVQAWWEQCKEWMLYYKSQSAPLVQDLQGLLQAFRGKEEDSRAEVEAYMEYCTKRWQTSKRGHLPAQATSTLA